MTHIIGIAPLTCQQNEKASICVVDKYVCVVCVPAGACVAQLGSCACDHTDPGPAGSSGGCDHCYTGLWLEGCARAEAVHATQVGGGGRHGHGDRAGTCLAVYCCTAVHRGVQQYTVVYSSTPCTAACMLIGAGTQEGACCSCMVPDWCRGLG
jgi:hypothetical protein